MANQSAPQLTRQTLLGRALRLRCPMCGQGSLFRRWVLMHSECSHCHFKFEREPGYYLGSIYINYGLTALLMTAGYFIAFFNNWLTGTPLLLACVAFVIVFPVLFFPFSRAIWLAFDLAWDPPEQQSGKEE